MVMVPVVGSTATAVVPCLFFNLTCANHLFSPHKPLKNSGKPESELNSLQSLSSENSWCWAKAIFQGILGYVWFFNETLQWNPECFDWKVKGHILIPQTRCVTHSNVACFTGCRSLSQQSWAGAGQQVAVHQEDTTVTTPHRPELESNPEPYCSEETTLTPPPGDWSKHGITFDQLNQPPMLVKNPFAGGIRK